MIKREELTNPQSCMSRAVDDEMTFVLLARDLAAPVAIEAWVAERIRLGKNTLRDAQIVEALDCAAAMRVQATALALQQTFQPPAQRGSIWTKSVVLSHAELVHVSYSFCDVQQLRELLILRDSRTLPYVHSTRRLA